MNESEAIELFKPYDALIFDFGGIWIDIHYDRTVHAFKKLGSVIDFNQLYTQKQQTVLFDQFETGNICEDEFIDTLIKQAHLDSLEKSAVRNAWNQMLGNLSERRMKFLETELQSKKLFLLSNINPIHEKTIEIYLKNNSVYTDFYSHFHQVYFSHRVGLRKPNPEIFKKVMGDHHLNPDRTLFIDDSRQHIESAERVGLKTHWLNPSNTFLPDLNAPGKTG